MMDVYEAFAFWQELEYKYPVDRWRINGIAVWPLIRMGLASKTTAFSKNAPKNTMSKWGMYIKIVAKVWSDSLKLLVKDNCHCQKLCPADVVLLRDMCGRNVMLPDGSIFDHNMDPLQYKFNKAGYTTLNFEQVGADKIRLPRWSNSYIIDTLILRSLIEKKIHKKFKLVCNMEKYDDFLRELSLRGITSDNILLDNLSSNILFISELANRFTKRLEIIKPRVVLLTCWYSDVKMALALAAHRLNIPVVEIQHGMAAGSVGHPSYYDWTKIPDGGYALMPDYMWVWDESDYDEMITWAKESLRPFVGGHPMNLIWYDSSNELNKYYQTKYEKEYGHEKPAILMTLQWGTNYPQWIIDFINQHDEFTWLIRLHPMIDECEKKFMQQIKDAENIHKESTGSFPLEILLNNVAIHMTMHSSVVLDALPFACPSIVMHPEAKEMYSKQITEKVAYYADNAEILQTKINDLLVQSNKNVVSNEMQKQYKVGNDAIKKIIDIIDNSKPSWE